MFTEKELTRIKEALNTTIAQRITVVDYISDDTIKNEVKESLQEDYLLLDKILQCIHEKQ